MRFFPDFILVFLIPIPPQYHRGGMSSKSVHGREAKSLKNGIPTLCKGLQSNSSASPCPPPKQTNKQTNKHINFVICPPTLDCLFVYVDGKVKQLDLTATPYKE